METILQVSARIDLGVLEGVTVGLVCRLNRISQWVSHSASRAATLSSEAEWMLNNPVL